MTARQAASTVSVREGGLMVTTGDSQWTATHLDMGESVRWQRLQKSLQTLPRHAWRQRLGLVLGSWRASTRERVLLQLDGVWHVATGARIVAGQEQALIVTVQQCPTPASLLVSLGRAWLHGHRGLAARLPLAWQARQVTVMAAPTSAPASLWLDGQAAVTLPLTVTVRAP